MKRFAPIIAMMANAIQPVMAGDCVGVDKNGYSLKIGMKVITGDKQVLYCVAGTDDCIKAK